jgi:RNA polymerase sigma-70 factor (ECF subfamily)
MEGFSFREIGQRVGVSENSARVMEFRLRNKLRKILEEEGFEWPM